MFFSISGVVTFKNADKLRETVKLIPIDRMFIETDCPYIDSGSFQRKAQSTGYDGIYSKGLCRTQGNGI